MLSLFLPSIGPYKASGAVASSANDMVKLIQMFLRNGQTPEGVQVLSSAHVKEMTAVHVSTPPNPRTTLSKSLFPISSFSYGYGYGWSIGMHRGKNKMTLVYICYKMLNVSSISCIVNEFNAKCYCSRQTK